MPIVQCDFTQCWLLNTRLSDIGLYCMCSTENACSNQYIQYDHQKGGKWEQNFKPGTPGYHHTGRASIVHVSVSQVVSYCARYSRVGLGTYSIIGKMRDLYALSFASPTLLHIPSC